MIEKHFLKKSIFKHFGVILGRFGSFWVVLGRFGVVLGSFWGRCSQITAQRSLKWPQTTPRMPSNHVNHFWENRFLAHFWPILEPKYGHLKAFLGPKMTKTRSKQPKITPNHPQNGQKWCRNIFGKIDFWSFWGHFGSFWVILGHFGVILGSFWVILGHFGSFGSFWAQKMTKHCLQKPNHCSKPPSWPEKWLKIAFFLILYGKDAFLRILPSRISK